MALTDTDRAALQEVTDFILKRRAQSTDPVRLLFVTGAGLSADSGLPTYRGIGGLYDDKNTDDGIPIEEALSGPMFARRPALTWKYIHQIEAACRHGKPNAGHAAIAAMEDLSSLDVVVLTQNVDGFHSAAGTRQVIDMHGDVHRLYCTSCVWKKTVPNYERIEETTPPKCPLCQAVIRPDVVMFQEMLPRDKLAHLEREMEKGFDVAFSIGTTSLFSYISQPVIQTSTLGGLSVEINPGITRITNRVDVKIRAGGADALHVLHTSLASP